MLNPGNTVVKPTKIAEYSYKNFFPTEWKSSKEVKAFVPKGKVVLTTE